MLLDGAAWDDADLADLHRVVDFGPGQLLVSILGLGTAYHDGTPSIAWLVPLD
jgi:hypothetical protein